MLRLALLLAVAAAASDRASFQLHATPVRAGGAPIPPRFVGLSIEPGWTTTDELPSPPA